LLEVTVEISANGRMIASRAFYSYEGGTLSDDPDPDNLMFAGIEDDADIIGPPPEMVATEFGEWRLLRRDKIETGTF
ncbi:MAG: hypothetical protein FWC09_08725, partial [Lachnospiraceae bacterium]|nr:hypothetical protein [Lachnospiraceae bacterium]